MRRAVHCWLRRIATCAVVVALIIGSVPSVVAAPATAASAIEAKRVEAQEAQKKLGELSTALEMRYEELAQVELALQETRSRIATTQAELAKANADLTSAKGQLAERAENIYRNGSTSFLDVLLGSSSFTDLVSRVAFMRRISQNDAALVVSVKNAKAQVETEESALKAREAEQAALRDEARAKQAEYQAAYDQQNAYVGSINAELKGLIEAERVRQEQLAVAAAAAAANAARRSPQPGAPPFDPSSLGAPHPQVAAIALTYLGVPYVWGGSSPAGFDCSGLVQYCYARIGINLPRVARSQFDAGAYIPPDRLDLLQPGDMVFFGYNGNPDQIHHVGIYLGGGSYIHAPQTGDVVKVSSLTGRIATSGDYVGATRP
ncbi:MAG: hypothetical protein HGA39_00415 [Coriobacteriia bacterium]|nr:hypothetical protein [Coriobacteriia bacterium]